LADADLAAIEEAEQQIERGEDLDLERSFCKIAREAFWK
jgi:hypothetical protein